MKCLIVGASGATGRLLVKQLLNEGVAVKAVVREGRALPNGMADHEKLSVVRASLLDLNDAEMAQLVEGCDAVASCLGHNLTFKGIYGQPRRLVTDATRRLCAAIATHRPARPVRFVLMNTAGNSHRGIPERVSFAQACVIGLLRLLLPPHVDNEQAADFLRTEIGVDHEAVEWAVVRPDNLTDEDAVTPYELHASPIRSAIFNAGKTSRINVAAFMARLLLEEDAWSKWKDQMPVIYNAERGGTP